MEEHKFWNLNFEFSSRDITGDQAFVLGTLIETNIWRHGTLLKGHVAADASYICIFVALLSRQLATHLLQCFGTPRICKSVDSEAENMRRLACCWFQISKHLHVIYQRSLSVRSTITWEPLNRFSWNFIFGNYIEIHLQDKIVVKIGQYYWNLHAFWRVSRV
jgi:hypothetical protein